MTSKAALFALFALWGVGLTGCLPARAEDSVADDRPSESKPIDGMPDSGFVNRVWQQTDSSELPGIIRIFLSDGTLVMDSCWETHRLADWKMTGADRLSWNEDGMDIPARITQLTADKLTLVLDLKGGPVEQHYAAAPVPSLCPDMPKA